MCGSWSDCLLVLHPQITGDVVEHLHEAEDDIKADLRHYHEHIQQDITHGTALLSSQLGPSTALLDHAITSTGAQVPSLIWKYIYIYIYNISICVHVYINSFIDNVWLCACRSKASWCMRWAPPPACCSSGLTAQRTD